MTNAAAVIGLDYGGTDLQENPFGIFLEVIRGLNETPAVRGVDVTVPGRDGQVAGSRVVHVLPIELEGYIAGQGSDEDTARADFATMRTQLKALFDPTVSRTLTATLEDGSTATITARALGGGMLWAQIVPACARLNVTLESVDPEWVVTPAGS